MIKTLILIALFCGVMHASAAEMPGLKEGDRAPDFTLATGGGEKVALATLLKQGPVALVFVRSADWCPFCRKQLQALQASLREIEATGVRVVALSYDAPDINAAAVKKLGLAFPLLADEGSKVIDAYGVRNHEAKGRGAGIPHPVVFLVDPAGVIRVKLMRDNYRDRPESAEIIAGVKRLR
ncbi:peroxiredoxin family protein [Horticoccus sp. 23ND18S-11]|uniref:peroxiredoxin family protein n=1 Tax=Horticoccus sp. 23ND18S-11 TaxID=3391832 RepID=UPI0039C9D90D